MRVSDNGFFPWLFRVFFRWDGTLDRLPYLLALGCTLLLLMLYMYFSTLVYALYILPPPGGGMPSTEYIVELLQSGKMPHSIFYPMYLLFIMVDAKRLRSIGIVPWLAVIVNLKNFIPNLEEGGVLAGILGLVTVAYTAILILLPPKSVAAPVHAWKASGNGPHRMSGDDLSNWRVVTPAPHAKADSDED